MAFGRFQGIESEFFPETRNRICPLPPQYLTETALWLFIVHRKNIFMHTFIFIMLSLTWHFSYGRIIIHSGITVEEIHKNMRVTQEMKEEKYGKKRMCIIQNQYIQIIKTSKKEKIYAKWLWRGNKCHWVNTLFIKKSHLPHTYVCVSMYVFDINLILLYNCFASHHLTSCFLVQHLSWLYGK